MLNDDANYDSHGASTRIRILITFFDLSRTPRMSELASEWGGSGGNGMWMEIFKMHLEWGWKVKDGGGWFGAKPQRERSMLHRRSRSGSR